jgi:hypothetical protein
MKIYQIRYYTTLIAAELVIKAVGQYLRSGELPSYPQPQEGRYYSFMPIELKRVVAEKFNKYCESYHA